MQKKWILAGTIAGMLALTTACGNSDTAAKKTDDDKKSEQKAEKKEQTEKETSGAKLEKKDSSSTQSQSGLINPDLEANLPDATFDVVYENDEPGIELKSNNMSFMVDRYQVVHVTNAPAGEFDGDEAYIVSMNGSIDNQTNGDLYFNNPDILGTDQFDTHMMKLDYSREVRLHPEMDGTVDDPAHYKKGEKQEGILEYILTKEEYGTLKDANVKFRVSQSSADKDFSEKVSDEKVFDLPLSGENAEKQTAVSKEFYPDSILKDNVAEKEMLAKNESIGKTETGEKVDVTLDGVQFTKLTPTESYQDAFTGFGDENIVAATVKVTVKNNTEADITLDQFSTFLSTDKVQYLDEGSLAFDTGSIKPGETGEKYLVYLMKEKSDYGEAKDFTFRLTHLTNQDGKDLLKNELSFDVPK